MTAPRRHPGILPALCNECGFARTVSARYSRIADGNAPLRCGHCERVTAHAVVADSEPAPAPALPPLPVVGVPGWELVEALGVTVVEVPGLKDTVCLVRDQWVALIRPGLDDQTRDWAADWLFQEAASRMASQ